MMDFNPDNGMPTTLYINGVKRNATELGVKVYADSDSLPGRRCSCHSFNRGSVEHLKNGGRVFTSGNWYSLRPNPTYEITTGENA